MSSFSDGAEQRNIARPALYPQPSVERRLSQVLQMFSALALDNFGVFVSQKNCITCSKRGLESMLC